MDWHRLFGLILTDFFTGTDYEVEIEVDLSAKKQMLDVAVIRKGERPLDVPLPDGFEELAAHNLITFKSHQEALDDWALKELTGHYVNYRKQVSPTMRDLLPETDFRLFAVCARYPAALAGQASLAEVRQGVYDYQRGTDRIRVVVSGQLPQEEHNAMLQLFAASAEPVRYAAGHYRQRSEDSNTLIQKLIKRYVEEGLPMPYTMEDFRREFREEFIRELTTEERLKDLPPEERLKGIPAEELERYLKKLKAEKPADE